MDAARARATHTTEAAGERAPTGEVPAPHTSKEQTKEQTKRGARQKGKPGAHQRRSRAVTARVVDGELALHGPHALEEEELVEEEEEEQPPSLLNSH